MLKTGFLKDIQLDDARDFKVTDAAMASMGMSDNERMSIYTVVAAVLHVGNITFEEDHNDKKGTLLLMYNNDKKGTFLAMY